MSGSFSKRSFVTSQKRCYGNEDKRQKKDGALQDVRALYNHSLGLIKEAIDPGKLAM